jgi:hypothetical protein
LADKLDTARWHQAGRRLKPLPKRQWRMLLYTIERNEFIEILTCKNDLMPRQSGLTVAKPMIWLFAYRLPGLGTTPLTGRVL